MIAAIILAAPSYFIEKWIETPGAASAGAAYVRIFGEGLIGMLVYFIVGACLLFVISYVVVYFLDALIWRFIVRLKPIDPTDAKTLSSR